MTAVTVKGLAALQRRLETAPAGQLFAEAVREEAEALAEAAREHAPGALGETVEMRNESRDSKPAYAIGTSHPAGRHIEFGTARRPASPWLRPIFWARARAIRERLGNVFGSATRGL